MMTFLEVLNFVLRREHYLWWGAALILTAYLLERLVLLRYRPLRRATTPWAVAVVVAFAGAGIGRLVAGAPGDPEFGTGDIALSVARMALIEFLADSLMIAAILTMVDSVVIWHRSRTEAAIRPSPTAEARPADAA